MSAEMEFEFFFQEARDNAVAIAYSTGVHQRLSTIRVVFPAIMIAEAQQ